MAESTFQKIQRKTGAKPINCKCKLCKSQCTTNPCIGTPEDIVKLYAAGHGERLALTHWAAGKLMGCTDKVFDIIAPLFDDDKGACTFYDCATGLCELHDKGLKPTEGRLSSHTALEGWRPQKSIAWNVAKEWLEPIPPNQYFTIERRPR